MGPDRVKSPNYLCMYTVVRQKGCVPCSYFPADLNRTDLPPHLEPLTRNSCEIVPTPGQSLQRGRGEARGSRGQLAGTVRIRAITLGDSWPALFHGSTRQSESAGPGPGKTPGPPLPQVPCGDPAVPTDAPETDEAGRGAVATRPWAGSWRTG